MAQTKRRKKGHRLIALLSAGLILLGLFLIWLATLPVPTIESVNERRVAQSTKIYDRTGEVLLYDTSINIRRTTIPLSDISPLIPKAAIAIEDRDFYLHRGVKISSFLRAVLINTTSLSFSQGGSTITQQVVKNVLLTADKTPIRKVKEWVLSFKLEQVATKDEILEMYLNEVPYGGTIYGVEEASRAFFGKSASEVSLAEAAYIAAIPQAPTFYSPYGNNVDRLTARKNLVLQEMKNVGFISEEEYEEAMAEEVEFKQREDSGIKAPHFVFYVVDQLARRFGSDVLETGGLRVITTLDYEIQKRGEEIAKIRAAENTERFSASNAAFVAIDPRNGHILSMVGSRNYFDEEIDGNFNVVTSRNRQPGSTFKPFVYAQAFIKGYTPDTVLFDVRTQFSSSCAADNMTSLDGCYSPENYDLAYRGPLTMRESLAQSINVTSVKTLYLAGLEDSLRLARNMGIESLGSASQYGLTLVLGGGEVSPLEMTSAYGVFANSGFRNAPAAIIEITNQSGTVLERYETSPRAVLAPEIAHMVSDVLSDNVARAPSFGQSSFLHFPFRDVAVKTGTTNDYRDAWIIGYTPSVVLGAWAGNNDNSAMNRQVAGFIVAPMWREYMDFIIERMPEEVFPRVEDESSYDLPPVLRGKWQGGNSYLVDTVSGLLAAEWTPYAAIEERLGGGVHSILYWIDKSNPRGGKPANPERDSQFRLWEYAVRKWAVERGLVDSEPVLPSAYDNVHTEEKRLSVEILSPVHGQSFVPNSVVEVAINAVSGFPISRVEVLINGQRIYNGPFRTSVLVPTPSGTYSSAVLTVVAHDSGLQEDRAEVVLYR